MDCAHFDAGAGRRVEVDTACRDDLLTDIDARLAEGRGFSVATLNLDHLVKLRRQPAFRRAYAAHSHVVADGNPIVWMSHVAGRPLRLVPGCELVRPAAGLAARHGAPAALLGARPATLAAAAQRLCAEHPGLTVAAEIAPAFGFDPEGPEADACIERLRESGARLCFLALGAPKQEIFAARAQKALPGVGFLSVGAGIDFLAGTQKRAPRWMRSAALEWLWRAVTDPRRLAVRYIRCALLLPGMTLDALALRLAARPAPTPAPARSAPQARAEEALKA